MKRLSRAVRQKRLGGKPMPTVFQTLAREKVHIRRSEVSMIAGQSGSGKSLLALWHAIKWAVNHDLKGIYFSADSAELGQAARALAMNTMNLTVAEAEEMLKNEDPWAIGQMEKLNNLSWSFEDDLNYETLDDEVKAFEELWGRSPDFIIVDNLTDVEGQDLDEWGTYRRVLKGLTQLARNTDSAVVVLHHTSEDPRIKEDPCPPKFAIQGKCSQKPALILTTADRGPQRPVAVVKSRFGQSSRDGRNATWLGLDQDTLHFRESA